MRLQKHRPVFSMVVNILYLCTFINDEGPYMDLLVNVQFKSKDKANTTLIPNLEKSDVFKVSIQT